jgi:hypothetical protein
MGLLLVGARLPGRLIIPTFSITHHGITFSLYPLP